MGHNNSRHNNSHGDNTCCDDMGMESAELVMAEAKEAGKGAKRARP